MIRSAPNTLHAAERFGSTKFEVILTNHQGQRLASSSAACGGIGDHFGFRGRTTCGLYWRTVPETFQVTIEIPELRWTPAHLEPPMPDHDHPYKSETILGPWVFTVSLQ
jgi:hypothetical protein